MMASEEHIAKVAALADWVESIDGGLKLVGDFGRDKFINAEDIELKGLLLDFTKRFLIFKVAHVVDEYDEPCFGISHLGYQVVELLRHRQETNKKK